MHLKRLANSKRLLSLLKPSEQGVRCITPCAVSLLYATAAGCAECAPSPAASRAGRSIGASDVRGTTR
ncbi:unnamed protein product, partial [Iphiclides podalirius]